MEAILDGSRRIADPVWLPHPAELARIRENRRVTINITRRSYEVLTHYAEEHHIPYRDVAGLFSGISVGNTRTGSLLNK